MFDVSRLWPVLLLIPVLFTLQKRTKPPYPPGPFRWPIIGSMFSMPTNKSWLQFTAWKETYGDLIYLNVFGKPVLVLNSIEAINDLFEKRSNNYSDRPQRIMGNLSGYGHSLALRNNDVVVRKTRKLLHSELNNRALQNHSSLLELSAQRLCLANIEDPENLAHNTRKMAVGNIMMLAYGQYTLDEHETEELVIIAQRVMHNLAAVMTSYKYLVDVIPILQYLPSWFPGASFKCVAAGYKSALQEFYDKPFENVQQQMKSGVFNSSLISNALQKLEMEDLQEIDIIKRSAGEMYGAGTDTNISVISSFFLAMILYPEVQAKAQQELRDTLGEILPKLSDWERLPYIDGIVKESFRWNPSVPLAGHCSRESDVYKGYCIPARTLIIANAWGLTHNEDWYPSPKEFNPERHLEHPAPPDPTLFTFGFGRRSCPGFQLAKNTVFLTIATTLATCHISNKLDTNGQPIIPEVKYTNGAMSHPVPFKCEINARTREIHDQLSRKNVG